MNRTLAGAPHPYPPGHYTENPSDPDKQGPLPRGVRATQFAGMFTAKRGDGSGVLLVLSMFFLTGFSNSAT